MGGFREAERRGVGRQLGLELRKEPLSLRPERLGAGIHMTRGKAAGRQGLDCEGLQWQAEEVGLFPRGPRELLRVFGP